MNNSSKNYDLPKYEDYKDCMVAFIDILGFDSRVKKIKDQKDFHEIAKLLLALKETAKSFNKDKDLFKNLTITAISDSVIITMPYRDSICAMGIIIFIQHIQYELIATSFKTLLRGYLTRGDVYHKNDIIFGKGYSDAYKKEGEIGHAPRIVIDPRIIDDGRQKIQKHNTNEDIDHIFNYLIKDSCDGNFFIDYLKPVGLKIGLSKQQFIEERKTIKVFIEKSLEIFRNNEKIHRKYEWLKNYFFSTNHYLNEGKNA